MITLAPSQWNIRQKMLALAVVPLALITCLLAGYFIWSSSTATRDGFVEQGKDISEYLSRVTELYMFSGDVDSLNSIALATLTDSEVKSVTFFDPDGKVLAHIGEGKAGSLRNASITQNGSLWIFKQTILYHALEVDDFSFSEQPSTAPTNETRRLGWVQLSMDDSLAIAEQRKALIAGVSIASIGLIIAIFMAIRLGRGITRPLSQLSNTVTQFESGNFSARVPELSGDEFHLLEQVLNRMAERVDHISEELQQRVTKATKQLTETLDDLEHQNQELETTRNELIAADQAKDEFLARMSHELRTPLTSILGYSELMDTLGLPEQQQEFNRIVQNSSNLLLSVINDILDVTKLRSNAVELEILPFDLELCLENLIAMHAQQAFEKGLELVLLIESDVPTQVAGDELRLRQIINNLISNAIKFTETGEVVVSLSAQALSEQSITLNIQIKDSGIGINPEEIPHLFRDFSQADASITRRYGGTGLGLVIVKRLAKLMKGEVQLSSVEGQGTEINCQLHFALEQSAAPRPRYDGSARGKSFLIYDQHPWSLKALRHQVLKCTTRITTVNSQLALLQKIGEQNPRFDILQNPRFDILQNPRFDILIVGLCRDEIQTGALENLLRSIREFTNTPILLVAGIAMLPLQRNPDLWSKYQPIDFISKPSRTTTFSARLAHLTGATNEGPTDQAPIATPTGITNSLKGAVILIAEDNDYIRQLITKVLENAGAKVIQTQNGKEAVTAFRKNKPDILLLDLNMPEMSGFEAAEHIRAEQSSTQFFMFALTAAIPGGKKDDKKLDIFDSLFYKPINQPELIAMLARYWATPTEKTDVSKDKPLIETSQTKLKNEIFRLSSLLEEAIDQVNREDIKSYAHQLLGIAGATDYPELADSVLLIETISQDANQKTLQQHFAQLQQRLSADFS